MNNSIVKSSHDGTNSILFNFDVLVDTDFGVIKYLYEKEPTTYSDYLQTEDVCSDMITGINLRDRYYSNPLSIICFGYESYRDVVDPIYDKLISEHYSEILERSTINLEIYNMMLIYMQEKDIKVGVYCHNDLEVKYITEAFDNFKDKCQYDIVTIPELLVKYDNIFVKYINDMNVFNIDNIVKKNIFVANIFLNKNPKTNNLDVSQILPLINISSNIIHTYNTLGAGERMIRDKKLSFKRCRELRVKKVEIENKEQFKKDREKFRSIIKRYKSASVDDEV